MVCFLDIPDQQKLQIKLGPISKRDTVQRFQCIKIVNMQNDVRHYKKKMFKFTTNQTSTTQTCSLADFILIPQTQTSDKACLILKAESGTFMARKNIQFSERDFFSLHILYSPINDTRGKISASRRNKVITILAM